MPKSKDKGVMHYSTEPWPGDDVDVFGRAMRPGGSGGSQRHLGSFRELRQELEERDPAFKKAWEALEAKRRIVSVLLRLRSRANLTQKELAEKAGWKPSFVSRLESFPREGEKLYMPDVMTLMRYAEVCGSDFGMVFAEPKGRGTGIHISGALGLGESARFTRAMEAFVDTDIGIRNRAIQSIEKDKVES